MNQPAARPVVVIVGGGFSGAAVAYHLARRRGPAPEIVVVEPRETLGGGLAYSSPDPSHRINVPARRMSLSTEEPDGFTDWLTETGATDGDADVSALDGELFPQRAVFGRYVAEQLRPFLDAGTVRHERARATAAERQGELFTVRLDDGRGITADAVVVVTTHPLPSVPPALAPLAEHPAFHADPYDSERLTLVAPDERVLVVGTGLTMADTIASLDRRGHRGPILALSRHGWRSRGHAAGSFEPFGDFTSDPARSPGALVGRIRRELKRSADAGQPWQAVFDALRRQGPAIWAALPERERSRLLRNLRTLWDVHRFRIAPQVEAVLDRRLNEGSLRIVAASLRGARQVGTAFEITVRPRHAAEEEALLADRIILTTGPAHGAVARRNPLVASLVAAGLAQPDALGLGLDTSPGGRAVSPSGAQTPGLFVAGPLARATFGELMGLPEVTAYAELIAEEVGRSLEHRHRAAAPARRAS